MIRSRLGRNDQLGFTLIEVLVAIGLMGLLALGIAEIYRQQMFVQDKVRDRGALEDLRNVVRSVVKCEFPCAVNVARIPVKQGRWTLAPLCDDRGLQVLVTDAKKRAPEKTSSLFAINDGYICLYLDHQLSQPLNLPSSLGPNGEPTTVPANEALQQLEELLKVMKDVAPE